MSSTVTVRLMRRSWFFSRASFCRLVQTLVQNGAQLAKLTFSLMPPSETSKLKKP